MMGTKESSTPKGRNAGSSTNFSNYNSTRNLFREPTEIIVDEPSTWDVMGQNKNEESPYDVNNEMNKKIILYKGDITKIKADAVVNAANSYLRGGGGVDGAIHDAAGRELYQYLCWHYKHCDTGDFKPTPGFKMPCKEILHGVGPIGENPRMLRQVYLRCMEYVKIKEMKTIAFPCISTGIYGYRNSKACPVVLKIIREWLEVNNDWDGKIIFCCYSTTDFNIYMEYLPYFFPTMIQIKDINELSEESKEERTVAKEVNRKLMKCDVKETKESLEQKKERSAKEIEEIAKEKERVAKEIEDFKKEDEKEKERMKQIIEKLEIKKEKVKVKMEEKKRQKEEEERLKRMQMEERQKRSIDSSDKEVESEEKSLEEPKKMMEEFIGEVVDEFEVKPTVGAKVDTKEKQEEIEQTKESQIIGDKMEIEECGDDQTIENENMKPQNVEIQQENVEEQQKVEDVKVVDKMEIEECGVDQINEIENMKPQNVEIQQENVEEQQKVEDIKVVDKMEIEECGVDQTIENENMKPQNVEIQQENVEEQQKVEDVKVVDNVKNDENLETIENDKETPTLSNDKEVLNEEDNTQMRDSNDEHQLEKGEDKKE